MTRRRAILVAAGIAVLAAAAALSMVVRSRVRPIHELPDVYYSEPGLWADFHLHRAPAGTGWVHLPKTREASWYQPSTDPTLLGFVRPEVCAQCHADKYEGFLETAHFRTSMEASRETVLGKFDGEEGRLKTRDPQLVMEMISKGDDLFQRVVVEKDGKVYEHAERFDFVVGSGNHGQTYLYWHGNELYQLPVSFFSESGGWINSPGFYRDGTADFARGIGNRCLDCHATYFAAAPGADFTYGSAKDKYVLGVTCVRCHGHGWAHVQYHQTHPNDPSPRYIVHPARLPRDRANEICAQCHSGVGQLLKPAFTYQPGDSLAEYLHLEFNADAPHNDDPHAANQLARLIKSRCYQESESLTCADCHDPHRHERGNLELFAQRCAKCHGEADCKVAGIQRSEIRTHCVECHMPSRRDLEGAMQTREGDVLPLLRDHYIKVWPEVSSQYLKEIGSD